ncbi:XrtA/PEP-CTERM system exopolysaccharide export protein [Devosia sp.]|uniref:XrtA/PEP-CTERM system exopolysaccharide export protein n=1 Tax=Devosia sp. TaxID=1871048 RepID=UPI002621CBEB|nr:XrtA/PEP-CTERM system exopolysaccharide export protein [Devosia sp.]
MTKFAFALALALSGPAASFAQAPAQVAAPIDNSNYIISTGDELQIFVWKNPDLSTTTPVRPDGKITAPLVQDVQAQGKTPIQLSADLTTALATYIRDPMVTVVVRSFSAPGSEAAIRVIGTAMEPKTVPYRKGITALDVIIQLGGLPVYASGNKAVMLRTENGAVRSLPLRLNDLMKKGDLKANVTLMPGDVIRIPERFF